MLRGKRALVTSGATGIGQGIAIALAERGADVVIHHSSTDPSETLRLISQKGARARSLKADLSVSDESDRLVRAAVDVLGGLDILVNNAGVAAEKPIAEYGVGRIECQHQPQVTELLRHDGACEE